MAERKTPAEMAAEGQPVGYMRRWAFDGVDVMKIKKPERPRGWMMHEITVDKLFDNDEPLFGKPDRGLAIAILSLVGNVDHTRGNGPNSALSRGELLNAIRDLANATLKGAG